VDNIKKILRKDGMRVRTGFIWLRTGPIVGILWPR